MAVISRPVLTIGQLMFLCDLAKVNDVSELGVDQLIRPFDAKVMITELETASLDEIGAIFAGKNILWVEPLSDQMKESIRQRAIRLLRKIAEV